MSAIKNLSGLTIPLGATSSTARVGGLIYADPVSVSDSTGGDVEVTLGTFSLPASSLRTVKDVLSVQFSGTSPNSVQTKFIQIYFGATVVFGFSFSASRTWTAFVVFVVTDVTAGASVVRTVVTWIDSSSTPQVVLTDVTGLTLTNAQVIKLTSKTTSTGVTPYTTEWIFLASYIPTT